MPDKPRTLDEPLEEGSMNDDDLSIILGGAIKEGRPLTALDLKNCNQVDLRTLKLMIEQEITLRLPQASGKENPLPMLMPFQKSALLTGQLNLRDKALTMRQLELLTTIKSQLDQENDARIDAVIESSREAFEKTLEAGRLEDEAFREAMKQEYGEEKTIRLTTLVHTANVNAEPTEANWGIMKVTLADGQDAAMAFVNQHADNALKIDTELEKKRGGILHDAEAKQHHFGISTMGVWFFENKGVTPEKVFSRCSEIKAALIQQGGCGKDKYQNLFDDLGVLVSVEDRVDFSLGRLAVGIDVRKSLEENLATIRAAAEDGNPKTVRERMGIHADSEHETQRQQEMDKTWLIYALQKEQGGEGISYYNWIQFIELADKNVAPTKESWGRMKIDRNADDNAVRAFILENIANVRQIAEEINQTAESLKGQGRDLGMLLDAMPHYSVSERIAPDELFAKEQQILDAIKARGGFSKQDGRSLQIYLGKEDHVDQFPSVDQGVEIVSIVCKMGNSPAEIVDHIVEQAEKKGFKLAA